MTPYRKDLTVDVHEVDFNGVARTSALMKYIQSAAQSQLTEHGKSYDQLKAQKRAFLLSRIKMEFSEDVRAYDELTATTFPCESRGYSFLRCYTLERYGKTIGKAVSVWALIDTETRALVKVNDFDLGLQTYTPLDMTVDRTIMPKNMEIVGHYTVDYGVIDQNNHMNNTAYPDMYSQFLPLDGKRIERISINYINEAPNSDKLTVFMGFEDGIYYFRTVRTDGKVNSEATVSLTDIG